ncbi:hypothetical protein AUP42_01465 [Thalassospira lucentensis]|uniref:Zinc finger/thioredoxin putative domain-containing protein n=1 Tax=Thalassospira lucentensis TaxID=168935 RepID=A0A154L560_9PROT|nr:hypothetical protein AUP42_01465 [Thalassospira lucentensis]
MFMQNPFRDQKVDIDCPNCQKSFKKTLGELSNKRSIRCPSCRQDIKIEGNLAREMRELDKSFGKLFK